MQDDLLGALDRFEGALDQLRPALGQHLDCDVVGDAALVDDRADEVEVGLRGGGKGDLDLLEAHADEHVEHAVLAIDPHRLDQRLVAVAQIDGAPDWRPVDEARRPLAVRQDDWREGAVLMDRHVGHERPLRRLRGRLAPLRKPGAHHEVVRGRKRTCLPARSVRRASKSQGRRQNLGPDLHGAQIIRAGAKINREIGLFAGARLLVAPRCHPLTGMLAFQRLSQPALNSAPKPGVIVRDA